MEACGFCIAQRKRTADAKAAMAQLEEVIVVSAQGEDGA